MTTIIGIQLTERNNDSIKFQEILTNYGCSITTRIGLHHSGNETCSNSGIILLDTIGDNKDLIENLKKYWPVKIMEFNV